MEDTSLGMEPCTVPALGRKKQRIQTPKYFNRNTDKASPVSAPLQCCACALSPPCPHLRP